MKVIAEASRAHYNLVSTLLLDNKFDRIFYKSDSSLRL